RAKFLAALRSMAGPPMAMFSTASARVQPAFAVTCSNGYRFSTSRSIGAMPCSAITVSSVPARPSRPPCTTGCRVLTRPSIISGKPVASLTSLTGSPASRIARAVPPVDSSSMPRADSARARSTRPVLSETDSSARRTGRRSAVIVARGGKRGAGIIAAASARPWPRGASGDAVLAQFLAQRRAVDAEHGGGAALVAVAVLEHFQEQRDLQLAQRDLVEVVGAVAVEIAQVAAHRIGDVVAQRCARCAAGGAVGVLRDVQW